MTASRLSSTLVRSTTIQGLSLTNFTFFTYSTVQKSSQHLHFVQTNIQQTRNITHEIVSLFITTEYPFEYDAMDKSKKQKVNAEVPEKHLLIKVNLYFNSADSASFSNILLAENAMRDIAQKRRFQKTRSASITEKTKLIELENLNQEVFPPNKTENVDENSTECQRGKKNDRTTEIQPNNKRTMENTTKKSAGTIEAREIPVVEKKQPSTTNERPWHMLAPINSFEKSCRVATRNDRCK